MNVMTQRPAVAPQMDEAPSELEGSVFQVRDLSVSYGTTPAFAGVSLSIFENKITAVIGPSGCGKSTFIRCFNRMNDLFHDARIERRVRPASEPDDRRARRPSRESSQGRGTLG
jgi:phosphate transport system ATP-binding protein